MYDGKIGRWLTTDPKGQFASPYEGMGNNPVTGIDKDGCAEYPDQVTAWIAWANALVLGKDPGSVYNAGGKDGWGFNVNTHSTQGATFQSKGDLNPLKAAWDSPLGRSIVPDYINLEGGSTAIFGGGVTNGYGFAWVLHGPEASFKPLVYGTVGGGAGYDVSAAFSVTSSRNTGGLKDIHRSDLYYMGKYDDILSMKDNTYSGDFGVKAFGDLTVGASVTKIKDGVFILGDRTSIGAAFPSPFLGLGGSVKATKSFLIYDFAKS